MLISSGKAVDDVIEVAALTRVHLFLYGQNEAMIRMQTSVILRWQLSDRPVHQVKHKIL